MARFLVLCLALLCVTTIVTAQDCGKNHRLVGQSFAFSTLFYQVHRKNSSI